MVACTGTVVVGISREALGVKLKGCGKSLDGRLEDEGGLQAFGLVTWRTLLGYCGGCRNGVGVRRDQAAFSGLTPTTNPDFLGHRSVGGPDRQVSAGKLLS